ncbi:Werner syndrome ATP-dependent helicase-like [Paramuricea clavata]|uniref:DNA 3'-5' helicase n=1 Tax=Paramuricea clavata TaxID=317549 RepID=A0A6S7IY05_PARCT|nr:Werner syndrome ATP-dependent helicase-like [Paramuricea clavata]
MDVDFSQAIRKSISFPLESFPNIKELKAVQEDAIISFVRRRDVFGVLPTGYGKSLIFQLIPGICRYLNKTGFPYPSNPILIVICPLNALIESHLKELSACGVSACSLSDGSVNIDDLIAGKFSIVLASPEAIVDNTKWRNMLQEPLFQENIFGLVTDEAHVVPKWGKGNAKERKAAFRQCFFRLGEVRSLLPLGTPVLALTATATPKVKKETMEGLSLKPDTHLISVTPNRPNIYLYKAKVNDSLECFDWSIDNIKLKKNTTPKTIVYCKSQKECGKIFRHFKSNLKEDLYFPEGAEKVSKNMVIGMFHANTLTKNKNRVSDSLFDPDGTCRVVFASTALGMGVNIKDIFQVIHYGPPRQADDFLQEIGRAGRNGQAAPYILFYKGNHLKNCDLNIKEYTKTSEKCLREIILKEFDETSTLLKSGTHDCCIICHKICLCSPDHLVEYLCQRLG